jgi:hypothetical protein
VRILVIFLLSMLGIGGSYAAEPHMTPWVQFAQNEACATCQRVGFANCRREEVHVRESAVVPTILHAWEDVTPPARLAQPKYNATVSRSALKH